MDAHEAHVPHASHTGHRWLDIALGGAALMVSCISLYVAVHHGTVMEKLVAANSWPNVSVASSVEEAGAKFGPGIALAIQVQNNGIGPARLESLELWSNGTPVRDADQLGKLVKAAGDGQSLQVTMESNSAVGSVIGAKETKTLLRLSTADASRWTLPFIQVGAGLQSRVCYCSVFDECDVLDNRVQRSRPVRVASCAATPDGFNDSIAELLSSKKLIPLPAAASSPR